MTAPSQRVFAPDEERDLVEALTRAALEESLPEELGVFEGKRDEYLDARGTIPAPEHATDEATGFGAEIALLLTPYIVAGALAAVRFIGGMLGDAIKEETKPQFAHLVRRLFRLGPAESPVHPAEQAALRSLPADTLARVHAVVLSVCRQQGLDDDDATVVSNAVAGRLALPA